MTALTITPDIAKKKMRLDGVIAAGEKVAVTIVGFGDKSTSTTRLRVMCCDKLIAQFPMPPKVGEEQEVWTASEENLIAVLNLNTVQAEKMTRCGGCLCLFILDDVSDGVRQLYGTKDHDIRQWVKNRGIDVPVDLDDWPRLLDEVWDAINGFKTQINEEWSEYRSGMSAAWDNYKTNLNVLYSQFTQNVSTLIANESTERKRVDVELSESIDAERTRAEGVERAKADIVGGKVPASQLPSYVDDVLEFESVSAFPTIGESGKIYIAKDTNKQYRWSGTQYMELGGGGAGEDVNAVHYYAETKTNEEKEQARQNIGAMAADTPIPTLDDTVTEDSSHGVKSSGIWSFGRGIVAGKLPVKALPKYLHALSFDDTYHEDAAWLYSQLSPSDMGRCSAVRRGGKLWRKYDWTFDDAAEFAVKMSGNSTRFASVGMASVGARLTENDVMSGVYSRYYRCLPGMTLDGINEKGVVAEINVDGGPKTGWHGEGADALHILAAVRWALDHGETAEQAAEHLAENIIQPTGEMNFHFMVADATATYIVENGVAHLLGDSDDKVLTNYAIFDATHEGGGKERYQLLAGGADISAVNFTNAYKEGNDWDSDFESHQQHLDAIAQWAAQGADREAHRGKTTERGKAWWQSVHTTEYDFATKTMKVAVQESDEFFTFAVDAAQAAEIDFDDEPTEGSRNAARSGGIFAWVKSLLPSWLTATREEPPTQAQVAGKRGLTDFAVQGKLLDSLFPITAAAGPDTPDFSTYRFMYQLATGSYGVLDAREKLWFTVDGNGAYVAGGPYLLFDGVPPVNGRPCCETVPDTLALASKALQVVDAPSYGSQSKQHIGNVSIVGNLDVDAPEYLRFYDARKGGAIKTLADFAYLADVLSKLLPAYSASLAYEVGEIVIHNGAAYKCKTAITTAEAWTSAHWETATDADLAARLKNLKSDGFATDGFAADLLGKQVAKEAIRANSAQLALDDDGEIIVTMNTED